MKNLILNITAPFLLVLELSLVFPELQPVFRSAGVVISCTLIELAVNRRIGPDGIAANLASAAAAEVVLFLLGGSLL